MLVDVHPIQLPARQVMVMARSAGAARVTHAQTGLSLPRILPSVSVERLRLLAGIEMPPESPVALAGRLKAGVAEGGTLSNVEEEAFAHTPLPYRMSSPVTSAHSLVYASMAALTEPFTPSLSQRSATTTLTSASPKESDKTRVVEPLKPEGNDVLGCFKRFASSTSGRSCPSPDPIADVDGGWAWVVFVAAFLQFFVSSGMYYSFSVFFVELLQTFEESRAKTGWVYSTNSAVHMFCGPLSGWVTSRFGPRTTVMLGGLLAGLGNVTTAFAPTLDLIFFTHGFLNAVGTSLNFCGWIVGLGRFWKQRHALAVGLAMSGSGFGVFFLGPFLESVVREYGWRGAMLICAGMSFNFSVFGATIYGENREAPVPLRGVATHGLAMGNDVDKAVTNCGKPAAGDDGCLRSATAGSEESPVRGRTPETTGVPTRVAAASGAASSPIQMRRLRDWLPSIKASLQNHKKDEVKMKSQQDVSSGATRPRLLCSPTFWLLEAACFLSFMATTTMYAVFLDWTVWAGISSAFSAALSGSGAGDIIGRMLAGMLMGRDLPPLLLFSGIQSLLAVTIVCASLSSTSAQLVTAMVGMGVACGLHSVLFALIPSEFTSGEDVGRVLGYLLLVTGAGALLGPPIAGVLVDYTKSYAPVLILCASAPAAASLFNIAAHCISRKFKGKLKIQV